MDLKVLGKSTERWDAWSKVTGAAEFTDDIPLKETLHGKICRATIAHGMVKSLDVSEALKVPGVVKILTPDDVPSRPYATAGHPHSLEPAHQDKADRNILTRHVRLYGDEIAAVIAETELAATVAVSKIKAEYEPYPFYLTPEEALAEGAVEIHEGSGNIVASSEGKFGDVEKGFSEADYIIEGEYKTQTVQHCHMETVIAYAYQDADKRWVCVSSTQIPHICKQVLGLAFDMPWNRFRVIKPFIGGGFGNKQDINIEPLVVAMSMAVGGRCVKLALEREEVLAHTRVRHAISYKMKAGLTKDGRFTALQVESFSTNGGYASHGHAIAGKGVGLMPAVYNVHNYAHKAHTVYTNTASAGAMRGYGIPQVNFAIEALAGDICAKYGFDPVEFRLNNYLSENGVNPLNKVPMLHNKLDQCIKEGCRAFRWEEKLADAKANSAAEHKRGVGIAILNSYPSNVYPFGEEITGCHLILNQDGTVKMMVAATEIGQGSDTVLSQIAAEAVGVPFESIVADKLTDTDVAPFDTGSYATRQTYVSGMAVKQAGEELKAKILGSAKKFYGHEPRYLDLIGGNIVWKHNPADIVAPLSDLAMKSYYDWKDAECLTADVSLNVHENSYVTAASFAEVDVDMVTGKVKILSMLNVHDSGVIVNPLLAAGQVDGGMGMAVGYALAEELIYDKKTGKPLNNNLLDYKMPTFMDTPDLDCEFVIDGDPIGPFGAKGLGEPPTCPPAPAIRNAVLNATGVSINRLPLSPMNVFQAIADNRPAGEGK